MAPHRMAATLSAALAILLGSGCSGDVRAPVEVRAAPVQHEPIVHTVHKGDSLYSIAWVYDRDYLDLAEWNGIEPPYTIYPGQTLRLKAPANLQNRVRQPHASGSSSTSAHTPTPPAVTKQPAAAARDKQRPAAPAPPKQTSTAGRYTQDPDRKVSRWFWPTQGPVLRAFAKDGNKGVDLGGRLGQPVLAAADGRVVYSGSGLIGYGKLIIVKHNKNHLSAYGHNSEILVKEGDVVAGGQRIANMGRAAGKEPMLHFEIRFKGKPVDPVRYLPKT